jgi:hypothetical protein
LPENSFVAICRRCLAPYAGIARKPAIGEGAEDGNRTIILGQEAHIAQGKTSLNLTANSLSGLARAYATVLSLPVVIYVYIPLRAALFDLHTH